MIRRRAPLPAVAALAGILLAGAVLGGCNRDEGSDAERFCGEIGLDPAWVVAPPMGDEDELAATLGRYRELADLAPVAIESEWRIIVSTLETASTVVPGDPASMQRVVTQAYATERSAVAVRDWLLDNCGIDLGPVTTITPHDRPTAPLAPDDEPGDGS